jgi:DNA processing protein
LRPLDDEMLCLVALCATEGIGPSTVNVLRRTASARGAPLSEILALPAGRLEAEVGLPAPAARAVAAMGEPLGAARAVLDALGRLGAHPVLAGDRDYPARLVQCLGAQAPPVLFIAGDVALLHTPCLAIVGSRAPSRAAVGATRRLAAEQAAAGVTVVSGGAQGIDTTAHLAAARSGGTAVVPAAGLATWLRGRSTSRSPLAGRWCAVGQFPPQAPWRGAQAIIRNRTIAALADAVVAFEPRDTGGTWHTSITALRMRKPLFVVAASHQGAKGRGLRRLVRLGAVALDPRHMPDPPALAMLIADYQPPPAPDQLPLFGDEAP